MLHRKVQLLRERLGLCLLCSRLVRLGHVAAARVAHARGAELAVATRRQLLLLRQLRRLDLGLRRRHLDRSSTSRLLSMQRCTARVLRVYGAAGGSAGAGKVWSPRLADTFFTGAFEQ